MSETTLPGDIAEAVARALAEDVGTGDVTAALLPTDAQAQALVVCREEAVLCGQAWFDQVFAQLDPQVRVEWYGADGDELAPEQTLCRVSGSARSVLTGERTALNFLQTLSGTATLAQAYARQVADLPVRILDTRKTVPGMRAAQKYAVACGGGENHRHGLFDGVLIKENHILAAGSIHAVVAAARKQVPGLPVEVEVENLEELEEALSAGADRVLLDNFSLDQLTAAVERARGQAKLEASGGVNLETVRAIAETGVDYISVGAITKDVRAVDLSLRFTASGSISVG